MLGIVHVLALSAHILWTRDGLHSAHPDMGRAFFEPTELAPMFPRAEIALRLSTVGLCSTARP